MAETAGCKARRFSLRRLLWTLQPIVLERAQAAGDGKQESCRPSKQQQAVGALDGTEQPPAAIEDNIAIAQGRKTGGREIERCLEVGQCVDREKSQSIEPDL
jgi:hypothetical protein